MSNDEEMTIEEYRQYVLREGLLNGDIPADEMTAEQYLDQFGRSEKSNKKIGDAGEALALLALKRYGVRMAQEIETPFVIESRDKKGFIRISYKETVHGDLRGVMGDGSGVSVLVEVKTTTTDRINHSELKPHQVAALDEHHEINGVSLFAAVYDAYNAVYILRWPVDGFVFRTSLKIEDAISMQWDGKR